MNIPIPGRPQISHAIESLLASWMKGAGGVVFLTGEPGSGKSHVLDVIAAALDTSAIRVDCRAPVGSFNVASIQPLQPFGLAIERLYQSGEQSARKRLALNIGMSLLASLPIAGDIFYAIKAVRQDVTEYQRETAVLIHKRKAAVEECIEALRSISQLTPFVMLVDDAHWSDPQSVEVLRQLALDSSNRILLVWSFDPRLAREHNLPLVSLQSELASKSVTIHLENVGVSGTEEILHAVAPTIKPTAEQLSILQERSGGLPGVLVEYVRYLEHTGEIAADGSIRTDGILASGVHLGAHPSTDVLLHEVSDDDALLLAICAAEGRECSAFMVAALMNTDVITAVRTLRRLEHSTGIIASIGVRTRYGIKSTVYRFTSDLAYTFFLHYASYEERKHIHQRIVEILSKEHDAADLDATRTQLAAIIAAHGMVAEDTEVTRRMLREVDPDVAAAWPAESIGFDEVATVEATEVNGNGGVADVEASLRQACDFLVAGQAQPARQLVQRALASPALPLTQRVTLLCLEARACIALGLFDEAERVLASAEAHAINAPGSKGLVLNVLAINAHQRGEHALARTLLHDAARLSSNVPSSAHLLTAGNTLIIESEHHQDVTAIVRNLKSSLVKRQWSDLARDLGLAVLLTVFLASPLRLTAGNDDALRRRTMEHAHPTPDPAALLPKTWPKVPFVQSEVRFKSQFSNVSMIEDEQDAQPMQNESSIAVNPTNRRNLIGSAVDYRGEGSAWVYASTDGGNVWKNIGLGFAHDGWHSGNDPSVCFDHLGRGYLCVGAFNVGDTPQFGENGVYISYTDDGGKTWPGKFIPVIEHLGEQTVDSAFEDKYYIHADTVASSPHRGSLYIPWKRVINRDSSTQIVISKSTDWGLTWSVPLAVGDRFPHTSEHATFGQSFPLARTGPDGSVHVVWNSGTESAIRYVRSTDGGATFTPPRILFTYKPFGEKTIIEGSLNSRVKGTVRAEAYPTLAIDNTGGERNGWLYLAWAADNPPNVYASRSTDNGDTWSAAKIVHADTANDQFWAWVAVDPTNGDVAIMYFDSRDDVDNILVNCYVSYSNDGGTTWTDRRIGDSENDLRNNPFKGRTFAGDYSGCDFYDGVIFPSWVDMRNTTTVSTADNDVYTAIVNVRAPEAPEWMSATTIASTPTAIDVAWAAVTTRAFGQPLPPSATYLLYRDGVLIQSLPLGTALYHDNGLESYREYTYTVRVASEADTSTPRSASAYAGGSKLPSGPVLHYAQGVDSLSLPFIRISVILPVYRLDGETPLVNLARLNVEMNADTFSTPLSSTDTGRTMTFTVPAREDGWYWVKTTIEDADDNRSPESDSLITFAGNMQWNQERFDSMPNYWIQQGQWGIDENFAYSQPNSFTESPHKPYDRSQRDTVLLYPFRATDVIPEHDALILRWRVAAFVDPGDTAYLELKRTGTRPHDWQTIAWWNSSLEPRWADTTKGVDAWRVGEHVVDMNSDTLQLRLRFRSSLTKHSDGVYIDDITWESITTVEQETPHITTVYPQPASDHVLLGLHIDAPLTLCTLYTLEGTPIHVTWQQHGLSLLLDVRTLPNGVYVVRTEGVQGTTQASIVVLH